MKFEWDDQKNEQNLAKHGLSFEYAARAWADTWFKEWEDTRKVYDETRFVRLALIENYLYHIVFTYRKDKIRIISARRATRQEQKEYGAF